MNVQTAKRYHDDIMSKIADLKNELDTASADEILELNTLLINTVCGNGSNAGSGELDYILNTISGNNILIIKGKDVE